MILGREPLGRTELQGMESSLQATQPRIFELYDGDTSADLVFLFEADPYDPDNSTTTTVYYRGSTGADWRPPASDLPSNDYQSRILEPSSVQDRVYGGDDVFAPSASSTVRGKVVLGIATEDSDDNLTNYRWHGAPWRLYVGGTDFGHSEFAQIGGGQLDTIEFDEREVRLKPGDPRESLRVQMQRGTYGGTGHTDGHSGLVNVANPLAYGLVRNLTPTLVDPSTNLYQVNGGATTAEGEVDDILEAYDGGVPWGNRTEELNFALLLSWTPALDEPPTTDQWRYHNVSGLFKLGRAPSGLVTADVQGSAGGDIGYVDHIGSVLRKIITDVTDLTDSDLDLSSFAQLDSRVPGVVGVYVKAGGVTVEQIASELLFPLACYIRYTDQGKIAVGQLRFAGSVRTIQEWEIESIKRAAGILPLDTCTIRYRRNWTVQQDDQLFGATTDEQRGFAIESYRQTSFTAASPAPGDRTVVRDSWLDDPGVVIDEAERQVDLSQSLQHVWDVTVRALFNLQAGQTVRVVHSRFGLSAGKRMIVLSRTDNLRDGRVRLRLWG